MQIFLVLRKHDSEPVLSVSSVAIGDSDLEVAGRSKDYSSAEQLIDALRGVGALTPQSLQTIHSLTPEHRARIEVTEEQARSLNLIDDGLGITAW